jgi:hypothetical protein
MVDIFDNLTERLIKAENNIDDFSAVKVGQGGSSQHELLDSSGAKVASTSGKFQILFQRESDKELMVYFTLDILMEDGTIHVGSWIEWTLLFSGDWVYYPATGTSGRFLGKTGFMQWRPYKAGEGGADVKLVFFSSPTR